MSSFDRVPELMRKALRKSYEGRPGVVHVDVPETIMNGKFKAEIAFWSPHQYRQTEPIEPAPATLSALLQWHLLHLATLDGFDGGSRAATLRAEPDALRRLQPLIADGLLGSNTVRKPEPTFALFAWVDEGGIVMDRLIVGCEEGAADLVRVTTDVTSISGLAQRLKLSRTQLGRKLAAAETMGSLGWFGARGRSRLWVSQGFRREYHTAQAVKLAVIDAACEACFALPR